MKAVDCDDYIVALTWLGARAQNASEALAKRPLMADLGRDVNDPLQTGRASVAAIIVSRRDD